MIGPSSLDKQVTVIGIGCLGLCLALCLERAGYFVLGIDVSSDYIDAINRKTFSSSEPKVNEYLQKSQNFRASTSLAAGLAHSDLIFVVVPTNETADLQTYDHLALSNVLKKINEHKVFRKSIVISSTVFPGYTEQTGKKLLDQCRETTLSYNPEFIAQGDIIQGIENPDLVLIGEGSDRAGKRLEGIYRSLCLSQPEICRMSPQSAEIAKLAVNCFVMMKIAFANLVADIADETPRANKVDILQAVGKDTRIGLKNLIPGYGFGGPCFPRDNFELGNYASFLGIDSSLFRATELTNDLHTTYQAKKLLEKNLDSYVFEDVCYRENCPVPVIEHSQKLLVAKTLADQGKDVTILDSEQVISKVRQKYKNIFFYAAKQYEDAD